MSPIKRDNQREELEEVKHAPLETVELRRTPKQTKELIKQETSIEESKQQPPLLF